MAQLDSPVSLASATGLACLSLLGPDAMTFLQGQLTCDMQPLVWQDGKGGVSLATRLNLKGRVMASLWVLGVPDGFLLLLPDVQADSFLADLKKYVLFSKAKLASEVWPVLAESAVAQGLAAGEVAAQGSDVLAKLPHVDQCLRIRQSVAPVANHHAFVLAVLQAGVAMVLPQTAGLWLPQELSYDTLGAVSYQKGCYLGQEIVARLHFKGEVKQHLYQLTLTSHAEQEVPAPAAVVQTMDGKTVGQLVQALAVDGASAATTRLTCLAVLRETVAIELTIGTSHWQVAACQPAVAP